MSFEKFLNNEIENEKENQDRLKSQLKAIKAKEREEQNRIHAEHLSFRQLVEETHNLLKPVMDQFVQSANNHLKKGRFKLTVEKPFGKDSFYRYKIQKRDKTGVKVWGLFDTSIDFDVVEVYFGYNFYDTLFVVRMTSAANIYNYTKDDVLAANIGERFIRDLVHESGHYMQSLKDHLS